MAATTENEFLPRSRELDLDGIRALAVARITLIGTPPTVILPITTGFWWRANG